MHKWRKTCRFFFKMIIFTGKICKQDLNKTTVSRYWFFLSQMRICIFFLCARERKINTHEVIRNLIKYIYNDVTITINSDNIWTDFVFFLVYIETCIWCHLFIFALSLLLDTFAIWRSEMFGRFFSLQHTNMSIIVTW